MARKPAVSGVVRDVGIIGLSIVIAIFIARTDIIINLLAGTQEFEFIGAFVAGIFFTSIFTTAPAIVTLGEIAQVYSLFLTAVAGGLGAVVGDLIIFYFVRERLADHLNDLLQTQGGGKRLIRLFKKRVSQWLTFLVGGLIIASPLPDELGDTLLGFSKLKVEAFILLSFVFNSIGIYLIGLAARALAN